MSHWKVSIAIRLRVELLRQSCISRRAVYFLVEYYPLFERLSSSHPKVPKLGLGVPSHCHCVIPTSAVFACVFHKNKVLTFSKCYLSPSAIFPPISHHFFLLKLPTTAG